MEKKFTPGPWKVSKRKLKSNQYNVFMIDIDSREIGIEGVCSVYTESDTPNEEEKATAKLIAAAPDLLEALESMLHEFDNVGLGMWNADAAKEKARTAITKALTIKP